MKFKTNVSMMFLFVTALSSCMERSIQDVGLSVVGAYATAKSPVHRAYTAITRDNQRVEINECVKTRITRGSNLFDVHYSGKIGKKRITRADARALLAYVKDAIKHTYLHPAAFAPRAAEPK